MQCLGRRRFVCRSEALREFGRRDDDARAKLTNFVRLESGSTEYSTRSSVRDEGPQGWAHETVAVRARYVSHVAVAWRNTSPECPQVANDIAMGQGRTPLARPSPQFQCEHVRPKRPRLRSECLSSFGGVKRPAQVKDF